MGIRRRAREHAMQALFFMDMHHELSDKMAALYCDCFSLSPSVAPFFNTLLSGVLQRHIEIDAILEDFSANWKMARMSCVDRNVMRIALYELLYCNDIPPKVTINEAIDVGKKFGTEESGAFINGILDSVHQALSRGDLRITGRGRTSDAKES